MTAHDERVDPAIPDGISERRRWRYVLDNIIDQFGGGFVFGTFLLRSDGALLCQHGDGNTTPAGTLGMIRRHSHRPHSGRLVKRSTAQRQHPRPSAS
jgi:hypothetical protein